MSDRPSLTDDTLAVTRLPSESDHRAADVLDRGDVVGRYLVLSKLGAGGMGVVYAAYDPELDRKVALKLLLPGRNGGEARSRLLREAQALARLQHPNVVTVHDVGTHDDRVWLAMELIEGQTLAQWRSEKPRRWPEVLDVLVRAGRGVAAAHAAGLLHRDLKPDNIMVGTDGRIRVMDFGLARPKSESSTDSTTQNRHELGDLGQSKRGALEIQMTDAGALMGTPAYMAPEQFIGAEVSEATDQFSLCVTLWEALCGVRPFGGETLVELMTRVLEGERQPPPRGAGVPQWLRRVVERGLSIDPASRWPSMEALLDALARGQSRARWRRGLAMLGITGLCAGAFVGWQELDRRRRVSSCEAAGASIAEAWNDDARQRLALALIGTNVSHAEVTADKVMPWLDAYAAAWQGARTNACLDAEVHGTWDEDVHDRAKWCLDERRMEVEALIEELSRGTPEGVGRAVQSAAGLERIEPCRERDVLVRRPTPPSDRREDVRAVHAELSRASALERTGAYQAALLLAREALEHAETLAWPPLAAAARLRLGHCLEKAGAYAEAEETLEAAYFEAATAGAAEVATAAAEALASVVGYRLARHAEGLRWSRLAEIGLAALPDVAGMLEATHLTRLANVHQAMGEYEQAKVFHERALAIQQKALGPDHPNVATSLNNLAIVHWFMSGYERAKALYERALAVQEKALGPDHPNVATSLTNLALVHGATGENEQAKALYERALAIRVNALGPDHPDVATSLNNLALVHQATGSYEQAKGLHERALAIWEQALGSDHPHVATSLNNLAVVHQAMDEPDEAKALYERALATQEQSLGPDHPDVAASLNNLANTHQATGSYERAKVLHERALTIRENALGADHPDVAKSLNNLANVHQATGSYERAKALHERALAILETAFGQDHAEVATALNNLAVVHQATGSYQQAKALHERALAILETALGPDHPQVADALVGIARVGLARGRSAEAVAFAERAVQIRKGADVPATELANARFLLARALVSAGESKARAVALAEQARDAYRDAGDAHRDTLANIDAWLREHL